MTKDINVVINNQKFTIRACALIINDNKILFQKKDKDKFWALPGGKIKIGETIKDAIIRELKEELNITNITIEKLVSVVENFFEWKGEKVHQYIFTYKINILDKSIMGNKNEFKIIEDDLMFKWIDVNDLNSRSIKPDYVVNQILNYNNEILFETCIE